MQICDRSQRGLTPAARTLKAAVRYCSRTRRSHLTRSLTLDLLQRAAYRYGRGGELFHAGTNYVRQLVSEKRGSYLLIERHCPICEAARSCTGLCKTELEVFQKSLGSDAVVERTQHLLSGGDRCVYRIQKTE